MTRLESATVIKAARVAKGLTWGELAAIADRSLVWTTAALHGQHVLDLHQITAIGDALDLDAETRVAMALAPVRTSEATDTSDPLVYRLTEAVTVYAEAIRSLVAEEFGDGIVSAIDFTMDFERVADPKGDRVKLTFNGKFLPYKVF